MKRKIIHRHSRGEEIIHIQFTQQGLAGAYASALTTGFDLEQNGPPTDPIELKCIELMRNAQNPHLRIAFETGQQAGKTAPFAPLTDEQKAPLLQTAWTRLLEENPEIVEAIERCPET